MQINPEENLQLLSFYIKFLNFLGKIYTPYLVSNDPLPNFTILILHDTMVT